MKRLFFCCLSLLVSGTLALAQNGKVVTPRTVNPSGEGVPVSDSAVPADPEGGSRPFSNGKWYFGIGGGLDYSSADGWYINLSPDVSYKVSDALFVGSILSYSYYAGEHLAGVIPYARWHIVPLGKAISVYAKAYAPVQFWTDYLHMGVRVKPGLAVRISEGVYLMGAFGSVGYSYYRSGGISDAGWNSRWDGDTLEIGVFFNL